LNLITGYSVEKWPHQEGYENTLSWNIDLKDYKFINAFKWRFTAQKVGIKIAIKKWNMYEQKETFE